MSEYVHIVSLVAPSPPDYGGAFDLFYKIPALAKLGKKIILHYFDYKEDRGHEALEPYCVEINKYHRTSFLKSLLTVEPYIVSSRIHPKLIHRLRQDDYPVLLEGIHCTGIIPYLKNRKIIVRVHNDEAEYYRQLRKNERNGLKAFYFLYESALLLHYQKNFPENQRLFSFPKQTSKILKKNIIKKTRFFFHVSFPGKRSTPYQARGAIAFTMLI